ncbi:hypothetical protein Y032_0069g295 [Ancylostoma ceylanicum]|uniref:Uncharacterized protein n=1 Tax=Ancylostoma ceylanicum TaxID=53326 RepID=A0A016TXQ6_9BILA|nr:hypothetical protein Y032_0069g295 [Ancylostoma ceylanicum]
MANKKFRKRPFHSDSFYSDSNKTHIDNVLLKHRDQALVTGEKFVPYETVTSQHRLLICPMKITLPNQKLIERCQIGSNRVVETKTGRSSCENNCNVFLAKTILTLTSI